MQQITLVKQRSDYTFKYNRNLGRHGWFRLTPAYSVKVVEEILDSATPDTRVLDPFSGTGTTPLTASYYGHGATAIEINPFLVWLGQVKTAVYDESTVAETREVAETILNVLEDITPMAPPSIYNIQRWWSADALSFLCTLKSAIKQYATNSKVKALLMIAFCRQMINISNASFNHVSMSFKNSAHTQYSLISLADMFRDEIGYVLSSAYMNPETLVEVVSGDSRNLPEVVKGAFDLLITSPPYPNRISYIRELRPYMYWLDYIKEAKEAGELDWHTIGGTWGCATSRLSTWEPSSDGYYPKYFRDIIERIANGANKNGILMAKYVAKYFEDMWVHLQNMKKVMSNNAYVHYIVGNSTFYNVLLPVEKIYRDMLADLGFVDLEINTIRKRNSKKELFEFDVVGRRV